MTPEDFDIREQCTRFLSFHQPQSPAAALSELLKHPMSGLRADYYGQGGAIEILEARLAQLFEKESALFFIKGVTAQQSILRVYKERRQSPFMVIHPLSHIDYDEANGAEIVHGMHVVRVGQYEPFVLNDLRTVTDRLAAVVVELPLRRAAYRLPAWKELNAISNWCREQGAPFHVDGARIWEAAAGYGRSLAEISRLADTIYVSFYKGLGGLGGCALLGSAQDIEAVRIWKTRLGGNLYTAYPYALSALSGLDRLLPRMPEFVERARHLAARLSQQQELQVLTPRPDANAITVLFRGTPEECKIAHRAFAKETQAWLFNSFFPSQISGRAVAEIVIGEAADAYSDEEATAWLMELAARVSSDQL